MGSYPASHKIGRHTGGILVTMMPWIMLSVSIAGEEPPPQREPDAPLPSGTMLRAMMADAGFTDILTPTTTPQPQPLPPLPQQAEGPVHTVMPPGSGGRPAPGFALLLTLPSPADAPQVSVGDVDFVPRDDGVAPDVLAGDGVWTAMIERYPPEHALSVRCGGRPCFDGEIVLEQTRDVPRMMVDLTR
ncbi:MAG: hypothetical protein ACI8S6_005910 [Myxococcota bacterium]|jgi:hypothetical protein